MILLLIAAVVAQAASTATPTPPSTSTEPPGLSPERLARIQAALQQQKLDG